jgi:hypothetical protein
MLNETTIKNERELILSDPIICAVLQMEADSVGVAVEEYCDRFLNAFYDNPTPFEAIVGQNKS